MVAMPRPDRSTVAWQSGLVQRRAGIAEPAHAGAVAERLVERLAERDRDVLDGVVGVDPQVALAGERDVDQRVARERGQHVVEKADSGGDGRGAGAVDRHAAVDLRSRTCAARRAGDPARLAGAGAGRRAEGVQQQVVGRGRRGADPDRLGPARDPTRCARSGPRRVSRSASAWPGSCDVEQQEVGARGPHPDARGASAPPPCGRARPRWRPRLRASRRRSRAPSRPAPPRSTRSPAGSRIGVQLGCQRLGREDVADPRPGQRKGLGHAADHHRVVALAHQRGAVDAAELEVGLVDREQTAELGELVLGAVRAGGIVGAAHVAQPGRRRARRRCSPPASRVTRRSTE